MLTPVAIDIIVGAELFGTSLWFSANAAADVPQRDREISFADVGYLTSAGEKGTEGQGGG